MADWIEVTSQKEEFAEIVRLLVEFDEKTGRNQRYTRQSPHWLRKAVSVSEPGEIRILLRHLGGFIYSVVTELKTESAFAATGWVHEDGIRSERDQRKLDERHPVHFIKCVTDLFDAGNPANLHGLNPATLALLKIDVEDAK